MAESIVIVGAKRTPIGSMQGKFNSMTASQLGAVAIKAAVEQAGVKPTEVDDLIFGNVLGAGQGQVLDHMAFDGLENAYDGKPMGTFADATAKKYGFTRENMDEYAKESTTRAVRASKGGEFKDEIAPVTVKGRKGDEVVTEDE